MLWFIAEVRSHQDLRQQEDRLNVKGEQKIILKYDDLPEERRRWDVGNTSAILWYRARGLRGVTAYTAEDGTEHESKVPGARAIAPFASLRILRCVYRPEHLNT